MSLFLVAVGVAAFAASALAGSYAATGSFVINDSIPPNSQGNVFSNPQGNATDSDCNNSTTNSQVIAGPFHYKVYTFKNLSGWWAGGNATFGLSCVTVSLLVHSGTAAAALYFAAFNPANPAFQFVGSLGGLGAGQAADFAHQTISEPPHSFDVIVYETTPNLGASYTLLVEGNSIILGSSGTPTAANGIQSFRASSTPKGVLVRWRTRAEGNALGFNVYRGDVGKARLTRSMVRASGGGRGHSYSYLDRRAPKANATPYYLEVVHRRGSNIMFGPARRTAR